MKFGVREICDVVFKAKTSGKFGSMPYVKGQPILYIDSAKTSTLEGATTTVYATGGKGNSRLIAWEGEKTLTFTVEDALLSPISFAMLSGAGLVKADDKEKILVHKTVSTGMTKGEDGYKIEIPDSKGLKISDSAPVFVMLVEADGSIQNMLYGFEAEAGTVSANASLSASAVYYDRKGGKAYAGTDDVKVFIDFYEEKTSGIQEMTITMDTFTGNFYVEAATLFRRQADGKDLPAELIIPNVKIQSNFTFSMASSGDPSTFTFTMDALPGEINALSGTSNYGKKVLCVIQIAEDELSEGDGGLGEDSIIDA